MDSLRGAAGGGPEATDWWSRTLNPSPSPLLRRAHLWSHVLGGIGMLPDWLPSVRRSRQPARGIRPPRGMDRPLNDKRMNLRLNSMQKSLFSQDMCRTWSKRTLKWGFLNGFANTWQKPACVTVKGPRSRTERSSRYYLMNDAVPVNYSALHNTRDGTQHKRTIECHCYIFHYDSLSMSTVTDVQGLSICCAYDMWVTKLLSMEIWEGRGKGERKESVRVAHTPSTLFKASSPCRIRGERLFFHMTLARPGEALVFHLNSVAKQ